MSIKEFYENTHSDYDDAMERLGSEKLIAKYLLKFMDLNDFNDMINAIEIKAGTTGNDLYALRLQTLQIFQCL